MVDISPTAVLTVYLLEVSCLLFSRYRYMNQRDVFVYVPTWYSSRVVASMFWERIVRKKIVFRGDILLIVYRRST